MREPRGQEALPCRIDNPARVRPGFWYGVHTGRNLLLHQPGRRGASQRLGRSSFERRREPIQGATTGKPALPSSVIGAEPSQAQSQRKNEAGGGESQAGGDVWDVGTRSGRSPPS